MFSLRLCSHACNRITLVTLVPISVFCKTWHCNVAGSSSKCLFLPSTNLSGEQRLGPLLLYQETRKPMHKKAIMYQQQACKCGERERERERGREREREKSPSSHEYESFCWDRNCGHFFDRILPLVCKPGEIDHGTHSWTWKKVFGKKKFCIESFLIIIATTCIDWSMQLHVHGCKLPLSLRHTQQ